MNAQELYAIGTLITWIGWAGAFRCVFLLFTRFLSTPTINVARVERGILISGVIGALGLIVGRLAPFMGESHGFTLPLVWFVMPFLAWLAVGSVAMVIARISQGFLDLNPQDRNGRFQAAAIWLLVAVGAVVLYKRDPGNKISILTGGIPMSITTVAGILILAIAGIAAMVATSRATRTRGYTKTVITQAALLAGSVVFGLPFAFLLITSFKEDRDMSSPNGIVWVPRVQQTVPYSDPKDSRYVATYQGEKVEGSIIAHKANGVVTLDIARPFAMLGKAFDTKMSALKEVPKDVKLVSFKVDGTEASGMTLEDLEGGKIRAKVTSPANLKDREVTLGPDEFQPVRNIGLRYQNYEEALEYLPPETEKGLVYLKNTLFLVVTNVIGTLFSSAIVAYAFSRLQFPWRDKLFAILLSTMMLPGAVTLLPGFLIWRNLHAIDTLYPLWVPAFFASAFNVFLLRQFFMQIPMELEDAAKIDGCTYIKTFWQIMMPQIKPALAVIAIWTFMGSWNNFMGPLIYINTPEHMPLSYALQLYSGDRGGEPGLLMAFATLCMLPVLALFFFCQRYFIEGVTLSGLGGR